MQTALTYMGSSKRPLPGATVPLGIVGDSAPQGKVVAAWVDAVNKSRSGALDARVGWRPQLPSAWRQCMRSSSRGTERVTQRVHHFTPSGGTAACCEPATCRAQLAG